MSYLLRTALAAAAFALLPAAALAEDPPDITGTWTGKSFTIVAGEGGHWPEQDGTFEKPGLFEKDVVLTVAGQEGRRLWGNTRLLDTGTDAAEPFVGQFTPDGSRLVLADTDGYLDGTVDGDTLSFCYMQTGNPDSSTVVSCSELTRQP